ncbi:hypothetical protein B0H16DRAFT_1750710 [Mycena metata]|uniref:Uncharacterized protein n=1 Tax=Mycena metata TaxID=1033252 RepID=A0AAD7DNR4_9AGAR|nr:hypothetical protein B0H16DRAFT_1750710 [Mycena metata]
MPRRRYQPSPLSSPEPERMRAPPPTSFGAPLRTSQDMPVRGSKDAPKTFKGKHTDVQRFIDHFEYALNKCRVTEDQEKCTLILNYCSIDVQNTIKVMEAFLKKKWSKLRQEILKHYDAERALQKYKPADVKDYALKMRNKGCYNLTQWRKYFVRYNSIAGGPLTRGHLSMEDYFAFFQIDEDQYTIKEWNRAAEWYFRRNKYETLMISAGELGEDLDEGDSGDESDDESFSSSGDESNYEEYRRKRKLRAKKKHQEKKNKTSNKKSLDEREKNKYQGNEEEIAGMIRKLNAMRLDDPEYAPIYYKVMGGVRGHEQAGMDPPPIAVR